MERPKLKIVLDISDWVMEIVGMVFLILLIGHPLAYLSDLPEIIPIHFNASGEADGFSKSNSIWTLPAMGLVMYSGLFILARFPHIFNYPATISRENAERQYHLATRLLRALNMLISASFFYIGYSTIQTARNVQEGLGSAFLPIFLTAILGTIGIYLFYAIKKTP